MILQYMTWKEIKLIDKSQTIAVVPLGSTEQHGYHLPLFTDTLLTEDIAKTLERRLPETVVLTPALCFGHSPHHLSFGAISSSHTNVSATLCDVIISLISMGFFKILLLNGHGGNRLPISMCMQEIKNRNPKILVYATDYWMPAKEEIMAIRKSGLGGMGHACELETSLMMYLHESYVRQDSISDDGRVKAESYFSKGMFSSGIVNMVENFDEFSTSGVFGKPTLASKEQGKLFFDAIIKNLIVLIEDLNRRVMT